MAAAAYTTKERVKFGLNITDASDDTNDEIDLIILGVSQSFDTEVNASFTQVERVERYSGWVHPSFKIVLDHTPSEDVDDRTAIAVVEDGVALTEGDDYSIEAHPSRTLLKTNGSAGEFAGAFWQHGTLNIVVTYLDEFKVIPADVVDAATQESIRIFGTRNLDTNRSGVQIGLTSRATAADSVSFAADQFAPSTQNMLDSYRARFAHL